MYIDEKSNFNILLYLWPFAIVISCAFFGLCLFLVSKIVCIFHLFIYILYKYVSQIVLADK